MSPATPQHALRALAAEWRSRGPYHYAWASLGWLLVLHFRSGAAYLTAGRYTASKLFGLAFGLPWEWPTFQRRPNGGWRLGFLLLSINSYRSFSPLAETVEVIE